MFERDGIRLIEISDSTGDAEDFVVGAGGKPHFVDACFHQVHAGGVQFAVLAQDLAAHLSIEQCW